MLLLLIVVAIALTSHCVGISTQPYATQDGVPRRAVRNYARRDDTIEYTPVSPTAVWGLESRTLLRSGSTGDYIIKGLSSTMDLAAQEYGLRDSESFYWGVDGNPLANLTAYADGEEVKVLSLERFPDVLDSARRGNNSIQLTFTNETDFSQVQKAWTWVNTATDNYIVFVTDDTQCNVADGDATERQPWHVTSATFSDTNNTVTLTAESKTWDEAFASWQIKLSSTSFAPAPTKSKRDLSVGIDLSTDFSGMSIDLNDIKAECVECWTSGELDFDINLDFSLSNGFTGSVQTTSSGLGATMKILTSLPRTTEPVVADLFTVPLAISRLVKLKGLLGLKVGPEYVVTANLNQVNENVDITTGFTFTLDDSTMYYHDLSSSTPDQISAWKSHFSPLPLSISQNAFIEASLNSELRLDLSLDMKVASAEAAIVLAAPTLDVSAQAVHTPSACGTPTAQDGVQVDVDIGVALSAYEVASAVLFGDESIAQTFYTTSTDLTSTCIPIYPTGTASPSYTFSNYTSLPTQTGTYYKEPPATGSASCPVDGALVCNGLRSFGLCDFGSVIWQPVADGTACRNGQIVGTGVYALPTPTTLITAAAVLTATSTSQVPALTSAVCAKNGALLCNGEERYGLCDWGNVVWQPVAAGTACRDGKIVWAR